MYVERDVCCSAAAISSVEHTAVLSSCVFDAIHDAILGALKY